LVSGLFRVLWELINSQKINSLNLNPYKQI
jgi:hypothetical protein